MKKKVIICGDFNINFTEDSQTTIECLNLFISFGLYPQIQKPTRGNRCIDNIFSDNHSLIHCDTNNLGLSDHEAITFKIKVNDTIKTNNKQIKTRQVNEKNIENFKLLLSETDWNFLRESETAENNFRLFLQEINRLYNRAFPEKVVRAGNRKPKNKWFGVKEKSLKNKIKILYDLGRHDKTGNTWTLFKQEQKKYRNMLKKARFDENKNKINQATDKGKCAWEIINREMGISKQKEYGLTNLKAQDMNTFFINGIDNTKSDKASAIYLMQTSVEGKPTGRPMTLQPVTKEDIVKIIKKMNNSTAKDTYGFSNKLLKETYKYIIEPLTYLINCCIVQTVFPDVLKITKVIPIYKNKGNKNDAKSYRPISLIPIFSKILEAVMKQQLIQHMEVNNLFSDAQYAYRENKSTITALLQVSKKVLEGFEHGCHSQITCLDLTKAFDTVQIDILLTKLAYYGIETTMFQSYLYNRQQYVLFNNEFSSLQTIKQGVPQGSLLGPLLFLIAINDIANYMIKNNNENNSNDEDIVIFADDTNLISTGKDVQNLMNRAKENIGKIELWFKSNNFIMNKEKTTTLNFSLNSSLSTMSSIKFLGITLDSKMTWKPHIDKLSKSIASGLFAMRKLKKYLPDSYLCIVYHAIIQSRLTYGIILWGHTNLDILLKQQKKVLRIMGGAKETDHCKPLFIKYKIMTVTSLFIYNSLLYMKLNIENFNTNGQYHNYSTRNKNKLTIEQHRLKKSEVGYNILGIKFFNKLSSKLQEAPFKKYKVAVKNHLLQHPYYSIDEFLNETIDICNLEF